MQIRLHHDGAYAVVSIYTEAEGWREVTRATFDVLNDSHYVGAFANIHERRKRIRGAEEIKRIAPNSYAE